MPVKNAFAIEHAIARMATDRQDKLQPAAPDIMTKVDIIPSNPPKTRDLK